MFPVEQNVIIFSHLKKYSTFSFQPEIDL